ncbi:MAG TPA: hypothetical protein VJX23_15000 [Candidatus Binataceae bacterium]|nr:hypothetical protein [Candidatus Binataceae bacterium]
MSRAAARRTTIGVTRRARALPLNATLWSLLCGIVVLVAHAFTVQYGRQMGAYWSGTIALIFFVVIGWYSVRKRTLWFSVRMLRTTARFLPAGLQRQLVMSDRLETWRALHITLGMLTILPLWWHMSTGLMSPVEAVLAIAVAVLLLSGFFGVVVQDFLPPAIQTTPEHEVRLQDVDSRIESVYVEAEEKVLGHQEALVQAYLKNVRPILETERSASRMRFFWATLRGRNPGAETCAGLYEAGKPFGDEASAWKELVDLAARKINLEHNAFNLHFSTDWLSFHIVLAAITFGLLIFHVLSVLYFYGI